ncbi:MAG TPA: extracellular solute-binding protein, partial [Candidatus Atribacteria bacterium]|nr:extracellular solute-binding protein [Candidatus Atribacteria bacterium]
MSIKKSRVVLVLLVALLVIVPLRGLLAQEQVTLRVLNYLDLTSPGTEREIKEIWEAFEKNNPDIKIEREDLYGEPFHQKLEAYAAAGNLPDVMYMWPGARSATLHDKKLVKD